MTSIQKGLAAAALAFSALFSAHASAQCAVGASSFSWWHSGNTQHDTGSAYGADWRVRPNIDAPGLMLHSPAGPEASQYGLGLHKASFLLMVNDVDTSPKAIIATLRIMSRDRRRVLAERDISRREFAAANAWQWLDVYFTNPCGETLETMIDWRGGAQMVYGQVHLFKVD